MSLRRVARASLLAMLLGLLALACMADLAAAQAGTSCRGSGARATAPGVADSEPVVANANADPCVADSAQSASTTPQNGLTAVNPKADTVRSAGIVGASASVDSVSGTVGGVVPIAVGAVSSQQTVTCVSGSPVAGGSSRVESLSIGGTAIPEVVGSTPVDMNVPTPVGSIRVRANQLAGTTRTGLILDLPDGAQNVYGEAIAGGDACLPLPGGGGGTGGGGTGGGGTGPGGATTSRVCPKGSEYVVADNLCVIRFEVAGARAETIVVGRPFEGPSGGSVIPLSAARKRFGTNRCLSGSGPRYAIVGTNKADRITGTNGRDRILTLAGNDRADGGRGDDCLDGGKGRDILSGALGRDRVFGMTGNDSLNGGGETDRLSGGSGNDSINSAFGADVVIGGSGRDAINVATAGPRARVSCGTGRDRVRLNNREKRRTRGCEIRYVLRDR
jgi:Ca2+-binding RTX toxin-like protein